MKRAPKHLNRKWRAWVNTVLKSYVLEDHHVKLLVFAAEAGQRADAARATLDKEGATFVNRFGEPRAHPCVAIERDNRAAFARLLKELDLDADVEPKPGPGRPYTPH